MKSRPYVLYLVLGVAAVALWLAWRSANKPVAGPSAPPVATQSLPPEPSGAPLPTQNPPPLAAVPGGSLPAGISATPAGTAPGPRTIAPGSPVDAAGAVAVPNQTAQIDVTRVRHMVSDFHTLTGENPVGTNAEIMKQMMGGNSHQATLGPPEGLPLNAQGELVDPWGTPYFFHQLSRDKMEVRSAGPDKVMWTADDVTAR